MEWSRYVGFAEAISEPRDVLAFLPKPSTPDGGLQGIQTVAGVGPVGNELRLDWEGSAAKVWIP